jgi:ribosomal protein S18 acetylase RimI-like enzyme
MSAVVRPATEADCDDIARVQVATWQTAYAGLLPADYLAGMSQSIEQRADRLRTRLTATDTAVLVVDAADTDVALAGFVEVGHSRDDDATADTGELYAIYVDPEHWGQRIGASLHDAGLDALRAGDHQQATLWVLDTNRRGRGFYERHGWSLDGQTMQQEIGGVGVTEVRYTTHLVR